MSSSCGYHNETRCGPDHKAWPCPFYQAGTYFHVCLIEELRAVCNCAYHGTTTDRMGRPPISQTVLQYPWHEFFYSSILKNSTAVPTGSFQSKIVPYGGPPSGEWESSFHTSYTSRHKLVWRPATLFHMSGCLSHTWRERGQDNRKAGPRSGEVHCLAPGGCRLPRQTLSIGDPAQWRRGRPMMWTSLTSARKAISTPGPAVRWPVHVPALQRPCAWQHLSIGEG